MRAVRKVTVERGTVGRRAQPEKTSRREKMVGPEETLNEQTQLVDETKTEFHWKPNISETWKPCFTVEVTFPKVGRGVLRGEGRRKQDKRMQGEV